MKKMIPPITLEDLLRKWLSSAALARVPGLYTTELNNKLVLEDLNLLKGYQMGLDCQKEQEAIIQGPISYFNKFTESNEPLYSKKYVMEKFEQFTKIHKAIRLIKESPNSTPELAQVVRILDASFILTIVNIINEYSKENKDEVIALFLGHYKP